MLVLVLGLVVSGCVEEPDADEEGRPPAAVVEPIETVETVEVADPVEAEVPVPPYKPSPEALASALSELRRRIQAASHVDSSELWKYVHENGTDNDIALAIGDPLEPIPEPRRACGGAAQSAAARELASIRGEIQDLGIVPRVDCVAEALRVVCDYTTNPHNTLRYVARVRTTGELDLWVVAQLGSRLGLSRQDPRPAWIEREERDFASFLRAAEADPCP